MKRKHLFFGLVSLAGAWEYIVIENWILDLPPWAQHGIPAAMVVAAILLYGREMGRKGSAVVARLAGGEVGLSVPPSLRLVVEFVAVFLLTAVFLTFVVFTGYWAVQFSPTIGVPFFSFFYLLLGASMLAGVLGRLIEDYRVLRGRASIVLIVGAMMVAMPLIMRNMQEGPE